MNPLAPARQRSGRGAALVSSGFNPTALRGRCQSGHDPLALLGRTSTGSLKLYEDSHGLAFELHLPHTQLARDIAELVSAGELSQMSFGFVAREDTWSREGGRSIRTLRKVDLFEIGIVPEPTYEQTSVALRQALDTVIAAALAARRRRLEALV